MDFWVRILGNKERGRGGGGGGGERGSTCIQVYIYLYIYIPRGPFAVVPLRLKRQELRLSGFSLFLQNEKIRKGQGVEGERRKDYLLYISLYNCRSSRGELDTPVSEPH